jgi:hypothetical protein
MEWDDGWMSWEGWYSDFIVASYQLTCSYPGDCKKKKRWSYFNLMDGRTIRLTINTSCIVPSRTPSLTSPVHLKTMSVERNWLFYFS